MRIAMLEDETEQAIRATSLLEGAGHKVHVFSRGKALLRDLRTETYEVILLDWGIPDISGIEILKAIRTQLSLRTPVIFLTHREAESDVVEALEAGADDFLIKPARERELLARVQAAGRRLHLGPPAQRTLKVGPFTIDLVARTIERDGSRFELTRREFEVAALLFSNVGRVLSRGHIMEAVWGEDAGATTRTVDMHVSRVRKTLGLSSAIGVSMKAVYGYGYRLEAETGG
jgi:two-component system, OmpR family, response regulator RegX3